MPCSPACGNNAVAKQLTSQFGERFGPASGPSLPLDHDPGGATGLAFPGRGRIQTVAEPVRLFGGSALVVHLAHQPTLVQPGLPGCGAGLGPRPALHKGASSTGMDVTTKPL